MTDVSIADFKVGNTLPLTVIAGPCQLESAGHAEMVAGRMQEICRAAGISYIFKSSYDKANRTSGDSARGPGIDAGLKILASVRQSLGVPVLTDVHLPQDCATVASIVDVLQIPAFLCRQTDLLVAAGRTGCAVNVKKGQFLAPWDMKNVVEKIRSTGNERVLLTERGTCFGYNSLIVDFRSLPQMAQLGSPVVMDVTHSVQLPGHKGSSSGGQREFIPTLARAAVAIGIAALFFETHEDPDSAPCDGPNMIPLDSVSHLISMLLELDQITKAHSTSN